MSNAPEPGSTPGAKPAAVTPPRTVNLASLALVLEAVAWVGPYLAVKLGQASYKNYLFHHASYTVKVNGKNKTFNYDDVKQPGGLAEGHKKIASSVASTQHAYLLQAFILGAALLLLAYSLRRTRGASAARWAVVVVAVLTQSPLLVFNFGRDLPGGFGAATGVIGILAIASLVLLFVPESRRYFREVREALAAVAPPRPARPARQGRGGGLFGPRPSASPSKQVSMTKAPPKNSADADVEDAPAKPMNAQEKKRADAAAVAKGAALARNRAKAAAKSRRMED